jgi:hypothetical protein
MCTRLQIFTIGLVGTAQQSSINWHISFREAENKTTKARMSE